MKILCYGDSNTWGYIPNIEGYSKNATMKQYAPKDCWWHDLTKQNKLFVDGLCGRCIAHDNRWLKNRNAMQTISNDLKNYNDLDLVIIQLGTNDCKSEYNLTPEEITNDLEQLIEIIKTKTNAQIAVISPSVIQENNKITQKYYVGAEKKSAQLDLLYSQLANKKGYIFISGKELELGEDGEHLTLQGHNLLKIKVMNTISKIEIKKICQI